MKPRTPVSGKVANGTLAGTAVALLTWILTTYIPAWHNGLPTQLQQLLPALVGAAAYFGGGYLSKHRATVAEIGLAVQDLRDVEAVLRSAGQLVPPAAVTTTGPVAP